MLEILVLSSAVSLATLGALLYQRIKPTKVAIPTFAYGAPEASPSSKLSLAKPPYLLWLLVVLITAAFCMVYFRDDSESIENASALESTVWIDNSVSSLLTLTARQSPTTSPSETASSSTQALGALEPSTAVANEVLQKISQLGGNLRFAVSKIEWDSSEKRWLPRVKFVTASSKTEIAAAFAEIQSQNFSPFSLELNAEALRNAFFAMDGSSERRGRLIVITDGQRASNQGLSLLKDIFSEIIVLPLPQHRPIANPQSEIIPRTLLGLWAGATQSDTAAPDFVPFGFSSSEKKHTQADDLAIPEDARPGLMLGQLQQEDSNPTASRDSQAPLGNVIFSDSSELAIRDATGAQLQFQKLATKKATLFTHCSAIPAGPSELNPLADLQALARFFEIKMRTLECREASSSASTNRNQSFMLQDPWMYRKSSMWLVPLRRKVYNTMAYQQQLFIPQGFRSSSDALFYYADPSPQESEKSEDSGSDTESLQVSQTPVQLEDNQAPAALFLAAVPPLGKIEWPAEMASEKGISGVFKPVLSAFDKTPLVFRFEDSNIFYLRTTLAMPNGELGRTGFWPSFWLGVLNAASTNRGGLIIHRNAEPDKIDLPDPEDLEVLDPTSLKFSKASTLYRLGLYRNTKTGVLHLVEPASEERDGQFMSEYEISSLVSTKDTTTAKEAGQVNSPRKTQLHALLGAVAGLMGLLLYWYRLARNEQNAKQRNQRGKFVTQVILLGIIVQLNFQTHAQAQTVEQNQGIPGSSSIQFPMMGQGFQDARLPERINVPFRIAWCSDKERSKVESGYQLFREMLLSRGTIHLQKELLFGACYPGGAEIWWTNSFDDLDPAFLKEHVQSGGAFVVEGATENSKAQSAQTTLQLPRELAILEEPSVGLKWERPEKRGLLYRSFYLLQTFDGCTQDNTAMLTLRKKQTAKSPVAIVTGASFFSGKSDCFKSDNDYRSRSFVNLMYALLTTDYKEDQLQLPELLRRVRNLGLEP